ncbi:MAG TPA: DUF5667 domain-containing protein [Marmoricola sp.]|nr:DUF5667 domain-containing protein [Marmoricola sp.]
MKSLLPAHRAAEEFAIAVDGHTDDAIADRYASLVEVVTRLRDHHQPEPRPEFVADLRSRLMTAAETELVATTTPPRVSRVRPPRRRERPLAAAAAALVFVGSTAGMAAAAQESMPGDALYPLKLGIEQASVALHTSDAGKGADLLDQAGTRLSEVRGLLDAGAPASNVNDTLRSFTATAGQGADLLFRAYQEGGDDQDITTVRSFTHTQMAALVRLAPEAPKQSRDSFAEAAATVAAIDQQARVLCAACGGAGAPLAVPDALAGPSSTASLSALIEHPVAMAEAQARAARALAQAAEAASQTAVEAGGQLAGQDSGTLSGGAVSSTTGGGDPTTSLATSGSQPVKDLLDGVTKGTGGLTNALSDSTKTATDGLTSSLDTTLSGGDPTGNLTDTVTGTVDGLLGGN